MNEHPIESIPYELIPYTEIQKADRGTKDGGHRRIILEYLVFKPIQEGDVPLEIHAKITIQSRLSAVIGTEIDRYIESRIVRQLSEERSLILNWVSGKERDLPSRGRHS
jgi:hypothetical protein